MKKRHGLSGAERLKKNFEFKRVRSKGTSYKEGVFVLTVAKNTVGSQRIGLSIGRAKLPLASRRNRLKRLIKEIFRVNRNDFKNGPYDIIVALRRRPDFKFDYSQIEKKLRALFKKAGVL